ncbi:LysR family transcriptional regulator [Pigmentiphaga litoralis]|uniref:LysR family transcriptional regulator n=1 Tax=Pigmentiphaga litoralis TaxID=516702 RepID=UPI003B42C8D7
MPVPPPSPIKKRDRSSQPSTPEAVLRRVKLRHLDCMLEVYKTGSLREAAQNLSVTESAASKTLKELETELGVVLFSGPSLAQRQPRLENALPVTPRTQSSHYASALRWLAATSCQSSWPSVSVPCLYSPLHYFLQ